MKSKIAKYKTLTYDETGSSHEHWGVDKSNPTPVDLQFMEEHEPYPLWLLKNGADRIEMRMFNLQNKIEDMQKYIAKYQKHYKQYQDAIDLLEGE